MCRRLYTRKEHISHIPEQHDTNHGHNKANKKRNIISQVQGLKIWERGNVLLAIVTLAGGLGTAGLVLARTVGTAGVVIATNYLSSKQGGELSASYQGHASLERRRDDFAPISVNATIVVASNNKT